jgi:hypothetical protein
MHKHAFYSMFGTSDYTKAPWKVVWSEVGNELNAAALGKTDRKATISDHTVLKIALKAEEEAYYVLRRSELDIVSLRRRALHCPASRSAYLGESLRLRIHPALHRAYRQRSQPVASDERRTNRKTASCRPCEKSEAPVIRSLFCLA